MQYGCVRGFNFRRVDRDVVNTPLRPIPEACGASACVSRRGGVSRQRAAQLAANTRLGRQELEGILFAGKERSERRCPAKSASSPPRSEARSREQLDAALALRHRRGRPGNIGATHATETDRTPL